MTQYRKPPSPSKWATQLLEWLCPEELLEEILGDLQELFEERTQEVGEKQAKREYVLAVLGYLRPLAFKRKTTPYPKPFYSDMIRNHLAIACRNLLRQKSYTLLNASGLLLGFVCFLLLYMAFQFEISYDSFHSKAKRIYRINTNTEGMDGVFYNTGTPFPLANAIRNDITGIDSVICINYVEDGLITVNNQSGQVDRFKAKKQIGFVEADFFNFFDYEWISGNPWLALNQPNSVVLTEKMAHTYFGGDALNKIIKLDNKLSLKVTGIVKDAPSNTVLPFTLFVSFQSLKEYFSNGANLESWRGISSHLQTYVLLSDKIKPQQIEKQFPGFILKYLNEKDAKGRTHTLQPLHEIHFNTNYESTSPTPVTGKKTIWAMLLIGLVIVCTACINYINLCTAQAINRAKEVGIRKLLGGNRLNLFLQFISETFIITSLTMIAAVGLADLLLPSMNDLLGLSVKFNVLDNYSNIFFIIGCVLIISLLAGSYPAWILSGFGIISALKNKIKTAQVGGLSFRRGLVIMQFFISQILIIGTIVIISQVDYLTSANTGFDQEAIVTVPLPDNKPSILENFRRNLISTNQIQNVSFAFNQPLSDYGFNVNFQYKASGSEEKYPVELKAVDSHYIETYGLTLLAGQNISEHDSIHSFIVNETLVRKMGLSSPHEAIGKTINLTPGDESPQIITGVIADFHFNTLHQPITPCILLKMPGFLSTAGIKINSRQVSQAIQHIEKAWNNTYPDQVFEFQFLDQTIAGYYQKELQASRLLKVITAITIFIGCLGAYGLLSYVTEWRRKEIGIRKTLGASAFSIIVLLSKESVTLIGIACLLAWPLSLFIMHSWLENFSYRITLAPWIFALAGGLIITIALVTISLRTIKAAIDNPVNSLRNE